jgi:hypothetical protein
METWPHPACQAVEQLVKQCQFKRTRRSGPGGQHRNKVETAVVITHLPTAVVAQASERRSQYENRKMAIARLRLNLAIAIRGQIADGVEPSELWRDRCRGSRITISPNHRDYTSILAEALDWLAHFEFQLPNAAGALGCSASQLVRLIKAENSAFQWVNQKRRELKMGPLK